MDIACVLRKVFGDEFQAPLLATSVLPPDLQLASTCLPIPIGAKEFSQGLSVVVGGAPDFTSRPRSMLSESTSAHALAWREWWEVEPIYMLEGQPVTRSDLPVGCSNVFDGFRIAIPAGEKWQPMALLIAGEDEAWPASSAQLADVRQMAHEVLHSPALQQLVK